MSNIFTISKDFTFSASHQLTGLEEDHPCSRMHGHNYTVRLEITGKLDQTGFVVDYRALMPFRVWLDAALDHRHLNDVFEGNPTAEHLSLALGDVAGQLLAHYPNVLGAKLSVSETPKTWATTTVNIPELPKERAQAEAEQPCTCGAAREGTETAPAPQEAAEALAPEYEEDRYRWGTDNATDEQLSEVLAEMVSEEKAEVVDPDAEKWWRAGAMAEAMDAAKMTGETRYEETERIADAVANEEAERAVTEAVSDAVGAALAKLRERHSSTDPAV